MRKQKTVVQFEAFKSPNTGETLYRSVEPKSRPTQEKKLDIYITCPGDDSVGIPQEATIVTVEQRWFIPGSNNWKSNREELAGGLSLLFSSLFDGKARVRFADECESCGKHETECKCSA